MIHVLCIARIKRCDEYNPQSDFQIESARRSGFTHHKLSKMCPIRWYLPLLKLLFSSKSFTPSQCRRITLIMAHASFWWLHALASYPEKRLIVRVLFLSLPFVVRSLSNRIIFAEWQRALPQSSQNSWAKRTTTIFFSCAVRLSLPLLVKGLQLK